MFVGCSNPAATGILPGSLKVTTNIVPVNVNLDGVSPASVVIIDSSGTEIATGETGEEGSVTFTDILSGIYAVTVTWMDLFTGVEERKIIPVTVKSGTESLVALSFNFPDNVNFSSLLNNHRLDGSPDSTEVEFLLTIMQNGAYLFKLKQDMNVDPVDTVLELYDANGNLIAENDDISSTNTYSRIVKYLSSGDYSLVAKSADESTTVIALLDVYSLIPSYDN